MDRVRRGELTYTQTRPAGWTAELGLKDMDTDGIELWVLYPTSMLGLQSLTDVEFGRVQARAYNDWCSDHLKAGEGRLFGAGALPPIHHHDHVQAVVDEIRHVAELPGMVSVFMRPNPAIEWRYFNNPVYDPIWAALQDTELPVAFHPFLAPDLPGACLGLKLGRPRPRTAPTSPSRSSSRTRAVGCRSSSIYFTQAIANPFDIMSAICFITSGGVAERFPDRNSCSSRPTAGGWCPGSSASTTTPRSSAGTSRG